MPAGRPSEYKEAYCEEVVNLMAEGLSLTAAMAAIGFHRDTALDWAQKYPEFSGAIKRGQAKRTLILEQQLLSAEQGPRVTARIFALKNAAPDEWKDKVTTEHAGSIEVVSKEQRDAAVAAATRADR